jgi:hypothetical protein
LRQASAAAPAPEATILISDMSCRRVQPVEDRGATMMAVPCWSSWKTGIFIRAAAALDLEAFRRLDVLEVDAAEGRLQRRDDLDHLLDGSGASTSMSKTSMPANFLNRTALPSITGLEASGPILPRPSTAVPLEMTATRLPRAV